MDNLNSQANEVQNNGGSVEGTSAGAPEPKLSLLDQHLKRFSSSEPSKEGGEKNETPKGGETNKDEGVTEPPKKEEPKTSEPDELTKAKEDAKKFQSLYDTELGKYKKQLEDKEKELVGFKTRIEDFDKDPIMAIKKHKPEVFENLEAASDVDAFVEKWQKTTLLDDLKKKFPNEVNEEWRYEASEAFTAGTASYAYRVATEEKRNSVVSNLAKEKSKQEQIVKDYSVQRDSDLSFIKEKHGLDDAALANKLKEFDAIHEQVVNRVLPAEKHPLALRNLYRGVFFDELVAVEVNKAVEKAKNDVIELYKSKGMVLPESAPTDPTKPASVASPTSEQKKSSRSPMGNLMSRYTTSDNKS